MRLVRLLEHLSEGCVDRSEAAIVSDLKYSPTRSRPLKHELSISDIRCERLLAKNMFAGPGGRNCEWYVPGVWCGDVDGVAGINYLFSGFTDIGSTRTCELLSVRRHDVVNTRHLHTFVVSKNACVNTGNVTSTDNSDSDFHDYEQLTV